MADYSNTMLATVTSLQKRQKPPKVVYQRALLSNLYPFYHSEQSDVSIEYGADNTFRPDKASTESTNIGITFEMSVVNSLVVISTVNDTYSASSTFDLQLDVSVTNFVDYDLADDKYVADSSFGLDLDVNYINFIDFSVEDSYTASSSFELSITT